MQALVTGGAGFIGGHIARNLVRRGYEVVVLDNLRTGNKENIPKSSTFYKVDVGKDSLDMLKERDFSLIYHFAGQSSVEVSFSDPIYDLDTNTRSTLRLLNIARTYKNCHFIYASSMSVYSSDGEMPKTESSPILGKNFYAIGKAASEKYISIYGDSGMNITNLRLFNVYGPGQNLKNLRQGMISIYLAQALFNKRIKVKGSLDRTRDFIYIYDLINYLEKIEGNPDSFGKAINICSGKELSVENVITTIKDIMDEDIPIEILDSTPGDIPRMWGCTKLLEEISQDKFETPLNIGLKIMIEKYRNKTYFE